MTRPRITVRGDGPVNEAELWDYLRAHAEVNRDNIPKAPPPTGGTSHFMQHGWRAQPVNPPGASPESRQPRPVRAKLWTTHHTHRATDPAKAWPDH